MSTLTIADALATIESRSFAHMKAADVATDRDNAEAVDRHEARRKTLNWVLSLAADDPAPDDRDERDNLAACVNRYVHWELRSVHPCTDSVGAALWAVRVLSRVG